VDTAPESPPAQGRILVNALTLEAPMIGVESARLALRCDEAAIMGWILSGDIEWAFDLGRLNSKRWYLRILTESVVVKQQRAGHITARERSAQRGHPFQEIFDSLFPHLRPVLHSSELARVWGCGTSHIHNLVQDGLLSTVEKTAPRREGFQIPRENVFQFMAAGRIR
jgi:hypothetical protein